MTWTILIFVAFYIAWKLAGYVFKIVDNSLVRWTGRLSSSIWGTVINGVFNAGNKTLNAVTKWWKNLSKQIKEDREAVNKNREADEIKDKIQDAKSAALAGNNTVTEKIQTKVIDWEWDKEAKRDIIDSKKEEALSRIETEAQVEGTLTLVSALERIGEIINKWNNKNANIQKSFATVTNKAIEDKEYNPIVYNKDDIKDEKLLQAIKSYNSLIKPKEEVIVKETKVDVNQDNKQDNKKTYTKQEENKKNINQTTNTEDIKNRVENDNKKVEDNSVTQNIKKEEKNIKVDKTETAPEKIKEKTIIKETKVSGGGESVVKSAIKKPIIKEVKNEKVKEVITQEKIKEVKEITPKTDLGNRISQTVQENLESFFKRTPLNINEKKQGGVNKQDPSSKLFRQTRLALKNLSDLQSNAQGKELNVKMDTLAKYMSLDSKNSKQALNTLLNK